MVVRSYDEECSYLERISSHSWRIKQGFQPNMNVEGIFYVNDKLEKLMFDELRNACRPGMVGGFLPGKFSSTRALGIYFETKVKNVIKPILYCT